MYVGKLVELAKTEELFLDPKHPYTEALMAAIPIPDPQRRNKRMILQGEVANAANLPSGCCFHPRCRYAQKICKEKEPALEEVSPGHFVACHYAEMLELAGVENQI
jgi:peptide/nickel transport system ATP-binding protein